MWMPPHGGAAVGVQPSIVAEVSTMKQLKHKNILPLYASFVEEDELWMVMPFVAGGAALDIMQRQHNGVPPPPHPPGNMHCGGVLPWVICLPPCAAPCKDLCASSGFTFSASDPLAGRAACPHQVRSRNQQLLCTIGNAVPPTLRVAASEQGAPRSALGPPERPPALWRRSMDCCLAGSRTAV